MTLPGEEFLRRFLQHILPRGFHKVRYYGIWRPRAAAIRAHLQQTLTPALVAAPPPSAPPALGVLAAPVCTQCGQGHVYSTPRLPASTINADWSFSTTTRKTARATAGSSISVVRFPPSATRQG